MILTSGKGVQGTFRVQPTVGAGVRTCAIILVVVAVVARASASAQVPVINVPRGAAPVVDGRMGDAEWRGSVEQQLPQGAALMLRHDGRHLFLAFTSAQPGFASVCVALPNAIHILHASAALGSVVYSRSGAEWSTPDTAFVYGMRNTALDEPAAAERRDYLSRHGWLASTYHMGGGLVQEMQISLERFAGMSDVAVAFYIPSGETGASLTWPSTLATHDGCGNDRLVRGYVPKPLQFTPTTWARLAFSR